MLFIADCPRKGGDPVRVVDPRLRGDDQGRTEPPDGVFGDRTRL